MKLFKRTGVDFVKDNEPKSANKLLGSVKTLFNPAILTREAILKQLGFLLFLAMLGILYIGNQYHAEKTVNEVEKLKKLRSEKRAEFISSASELMRMTRQSQVSKLIEEHGLKLKPLSSPPKKIIVKK